MESILFLGVMLAAMYLIIILPQQRKMKQKREMLARLGPGAEVVTSAGIYGTIVEVEDTVVFLDIGDGFEIKLAREAVEHVAADPEADEAEPADTADDPADDDGTDDETEIDHKGPIS